VDGPKPMIQAREKNSLPMAQSGLGINDPNGHVTFAGFSAVFQIAQADLVFPPTFTRPSNRRDVL